MASKRRPMPGRPRLGRREKPLTGPPDCPHVIIATAMRALKDGTDDRLSYRRMAKKVHICHTSLSKAANGKRQPSWEVVRLYVVACDGDVGRFKLLYKSLYGSLR